MRQLWRRAIPVAVAFGGGWLERGHASEACPSASSSGGGGVSRCCGTTALPWTPECFDGQPLESTGNCYHTFPSANGTRARCASSSVGSESNGVMQCSANTWEFTLVPLPTCKAPPEAAWRLSPRVSTDQGWWIHEVVFYSDSDCSRPLKGDSVVAGFFGSGPYGLPAVPQEAVDGLDGTFWQAPCQGTSSYDACMCNGARGEGWSAELQRCIEGEVTTILESEACIRSRVNAVGGDRISGCPASTAHIGIHLWEPTEVRCVRFHQHKLDALAASSISLERWAGHSWQEVRTWDGVLSGVAQTFRPHESCGSFPAAEVPAFAEIVGGGLLSAPHGGSLTIKCEGSSYSVEVTCYDGRWSRITQFVCPIPSVPVEEQGTNYQPSGGQSSLRGQDDSDIKSVITVVLGLLGLGLAAVLLLALMHFSTKYMQQYSFDRLMRHGAPPMPEREAPPKGSLQDLLENGLPLGGAPPVVKQDKKLAARKKGGSDEYEGGGGAAAARARRDQREVQRAVKQAGGHGKHAAAGSHGVSAPPPLPPPPACLPGESTRAHGPPLAQESVLLPPMPPAMRAADTQEGHNLLRFGFQARAEPALRSTAASSSSTSQPAGWGGAFGHSGLDPSRFGRTGEDLWME